MIKKTYYQKGFTLLELMIVIAIIAILTSVAYPNYQDSVRQARRSDAQAAMLEMANYMERKFTEKNQYNSLSASSMITASQITSDYYTFTLPTLTTTSFTINGAPQGTQASDSCGTLTLTHTGDKRAAITGCWN